MKSMMKFICLCLVICLGLSSCKEGDAGIGGDIFDSSDDIFLTDTTTLLTSTMLLDSMISSGTSKILVGKIEDVRLGTTTVQSYFQIGLNGTWTPDTKVVFDSLVLFLNYNYYSGDTTQMQKISLHQLNKRLALPKNQDAFYNTSQVAFKADPFAQIQFYPQPNRAKPLKIRMPDELGRKIFQMAQDKSDTLKESDKYLELLKGFALIPDASNSCLLGFQVSAATDTTADNSGLFWRFYSHQGTDKYVHNQSITNTDLQFNRVINNRSNTSLSSLVKQKEDLNSKYTNNEMVAQGGVGMMIKVKIPFLTKILELGTQTRVMYAELIVKPVKGTYVESDLPSTLELYYTDKQNRLISAVQNNQGTIIGSSLHLDTEFDIDTYYKFNLTDFVLQKLAANAEQDNAMLMTIPFTDLQTTFKRLVVGSPQNRNFKMEMKIIYVKL